MTSVRQGTSLARASSFCESNDPDFGRGFLVGALQLGWVLTPGTLANREEVRPGTGREAGLGHVGVGAPMDGLVACPGSEHPPQLPLLNKVKQLWQQL